MILCVVVFALAIAGANLFGDSQDQQAILFFGIVAVGFATLILGEKIRKLFSKEEMR